MTDFECDWVQRWNVNFHIKFYEKAVKAVGQWAVDSVHKYNSLKCIHFNDNILSNKDILIFK